MFTKYFRIETELAIVAEDEDACEEIAKDIKDQQENVILNQGEAVKEYACIGTTTEGYMGKDTGNLF